MIPIPHTFACRIVSAAALVSLAGLAGCESPKPIFPPLETMLVWPAPPHAARIHYVGALESTRDLQASASIGDAERSSMSGIFVASASLTTS